VSIHLGNEGGFSSCPRERSVLLEGAKFGAKLPLCLLAVVAKICVIFSPANLQIEIQLISVGDWFEVFADIFDLLVVLK